MAAEYLDHLRKFIPLLRQPLFGLGKAADYFEGLVNGTSQPGPLLDVSATLALRHGFSSKLTVSNCDRFSSRST